MWRVGVGVNEEKRTGLLLDMGEENLYYKCGRG